MNADTQLDLRPLPRTDALALLRKTLEASTPGLVLQVKALQPHCRRDLENLCYRTGNEFLLSASEPRALVFWLRRR